MTDNPPEAPQSARQEKSGAMIPVSIVACAGYDPSLVYEALARAVYLIGGLAPHITPGSKVLLKPNLLQGVPPERAVCTHPAVIGAMIRLLNEHGCTVTIADSPGAGIRYTARNLEKHYTDSGYKGLAGDPGCTLNYDTGFSPLQFMEGKVCREFPLIAPFFSHDHIVVVSKPKSHILTLMTGATKNIFGLIPGLEKPLFHSRFQTGERFGEMLVDLNLAVRPSLQVADMILAMEGDGPTSGVPRHVGVILASPNPFALDMVLCRLMSIDPSDVPYLKCAAERGLCAADGSDLQILGDPVASFIAADFKKPRTYRTGGRGMKVSPLFRAVHRLGKIYGMRPAVEPSRCIGCGKCVTICPVGAATLSDGHAAIDHRKCIRCFCCHEMCSEAAISLERSLAGSLIHRLIGWYM